MGAQLAIMNPSWQVYFFSGSTTPNWNLAFPSIINVGNKPL